MCANPWLRSDLTSAGLGRGLVIRTPRVALTYWRSTGDYALTDFAGRTRVGLRLATVLDWCGDNGVARPTDPDLAWLEDGPTPGAPNAR
jgi:hypothetical protein